MKKYQTKYEDGAKHDILDIIDCIENVLLDPVGAAKIAIKIYRKCESLALFPKGVPARRIGNLKKELRFAHIKKYTIIYYVDDGSSTVYIHAVINSCRDITSVLLDRAD